MSLFNSDMYAKENKKTRPTRQKKIKLPSQSKSPHHKCSQCTRRDATKYYLTEKEVRWLCPDCKIRNSRREILENPNFVKASKLRREK